MSDILDNIVTGTGNAAASIVASSTLPTSVRVDDLPGPVANFRYPENVTQPPYDKYIMFTAKRGRHIMRNGVTMSEANQTDSDVGAVTLYLPEGALNSSLSVQWSDKELGALAGAVLDATAQGADALGNIFNSDGSLSSVLQGVLDSVNRITESGSTASGWTDMLGGIAGTLAPKFVSALTGGTVSEDSISSVAGAAFGKKVNPRVDMLFDSVRYRTHTMQFILIPRTQAEAESIDRIIHFFQFYSLPSFGGPKDVAANKRFGSFMIGYPYEFEVRMFGPGRQEMVHTNRIGRSVITAIGVNHAQGQKTAFVRARTGEPYPVATSLDLTLQEVRLMGRDSDEINRGMSLNDPRA